MDKKQTNKKNHREPKAMLYDRIVFVGSLVLSLTQHTKLINFPLSLEKYAKIIFKGIYFGVWIEYKTFSFHFLIS